MLGQLSSSNMVYRLNTDFIYQRISEKHKRNFHLHFNSFDKYIETIFYCYVDCTVKNCSKVCFY